MSKEKQVREVLELAERLELPVTIVSKFTIYDTVVVSLSKVNMHNFANVIVTNNKLIYCNMSEDLEDLHKWRKIDINDIKKITIIFD